MSICYNKHSTKNEQEEKIMAEWTKDQRSFWFRCKDSKKVTTESESFTLPYQKLDAWIDELYKNNPQFHNDNDDMINDEELIG